MHLLNRKLLSDFCESSNMYRRVFTDDDGSKYLTRYYVTGKPHELNDNRHSALRVYLHQFHKSDRAEALHSHPWRWAVSLMLIGGYREQRRHRRDSFESAKLTTGEFNEP